MSLLFQPLKIKTIQFPNRIWVSPMCQYSSRDGHPTDWHLVHLGSRAVGGAGLVVVEATGVSPEGRISPQDSGIWDDSHVASFKRITQFIESQGTIPGIQLAHAGRKASTAAPWLGRGAVAPKDGGWEVVAPSAIPFAPGYPHPREMTEVDIEKVVKDFQTAAKRALDAGFKVIELHMAHGYLLNEFLSPISNKRSDSYGGSLENRMRLPLAVARAARKAWPQDLPLFARISATDWAEDTGMHSWTLDDSVVLCTELKKIGVDLIDCSTGGTLAKANIPLGPGYQVPFAEGIRKRVGMLTAAVGLITEADQAEAIMRDGKADAIFMAREFLRNPYWPRINARKMGDAISTPVQYERA